MKSATNITILDKPNIKPVPFEIIKLRSVTKRFAAFTALDSLNLDIHEGEILTLLGPSGCGKTTLMRLIAGFEFPTAGFVFINGEEVSKIPPEKRSVNMVFQRYALFPHLDVFDNVAFGLRLKKMAEKQVQEKVCEILKLVQLDGMANRWTHELSGGQAQRVALARALVGQPQVLLLDEPLAALDLKIRHQMLAELKRIHNETRTTFVYVTHDQDEAMILSDRIVLMNRGRIEQIDTAENLYEKPKTLFAAKFLGETNILQGTVKSMATDCSVVRHDFGELIVRSTDFQPGQQIFLSIRPESITLQSPAATSFMRKENTCMGVIGELTFIGSRVVYTVTFNNDGFCKCQIPRPPEGLRYKLNDAVAVSFPKEAISVLTQ